MGVADESEHGHTIFCVRFAHIPFVPDCLLQNLATMYLDRCPNCHRFEVEGTRPSLLCC